MYGRKYAIDNNIKLSDIIKSSETTANFLNQVAVHVLNSIEEYKKDPAYADILSGEKKIFTSESATVIHFKSFIKQSAKVNKKFLVEKPEE